VFFYDLLPDGNADELSLHAGMPVLKGEKWIAPMWIWDPSRYKGTSVFFLLLIFSPPGLGSCALRSLRGFISLARSTWHPSRRREPPGHTTGAAIHALSGSEPPSLPCGPPLSSLHTSAHMTSPRPFARTMRCPNLPTPGQART